ncbi:MAG: exodeoxyribonuclease III [Anaerolineales bacterium]|nr:exodeoxyribonuclease III [Anaerolineales bacterium]
MTEKTLYSWNVNGIRAAQKKGFLDWIEQAQPHILAVQETKANPEQLDPELLEIPGYHITWASAERKGYSGVAVFSKEDPLSVQIGLGIEKFDAEGRTIIADYGDFVLLNAYFPNGSRDHSRVPFKLEFYDAFLSYCENLRSQGRSVIFCGDVNTAHKEIDLARPKENQKTTGFLPEERAWLDEVTTAGYIDIYRDRHPEKTDVYSWWAYWGKARERNVGWRIDYFFITPELRDRVVNAQIHMDVLGSDHCPVSLTLR